MRINSKGGLIIVLLVLIVGFAVGIVIGRYAISGSRGAEPPASRSGDAANVEFIKETIKKVDTKNIAEYLRELVKYPHLAGTKRDYETVDFVQKKFLDYGFDFVEKVPYDVLLSYPDPNNPNELYLSDKSGSVNFTSIYIERTYKPGDNDPTLVNAYLGYAPNGTVSGPIVYVNYATIEDFETLKANGVNVTGSICLTRYGKIFRGNKVQHAYENGAVGVLIYTDPQDVALFGTDPADVYPNTEWLPPSGMQRGTVFLSDGDPLTPYGPAIEGAYRVPQSEAELPKIPAQPLSYQDAFYLLSIMTGLTINEQDWNNTYHVGPGFKNEFKDLKPTLKVNNYYKNVTIHNVVGYIYGAVEPDRYVIQGNHRDAWGFGAADPSSGTASMLETARVFGSLKQGGWRPRRTLVFCSWGAEEFGLLGSQEWVEEQTPLLMNRAVSYMNLDTCTSGPVLKLSASPIIASALVNATKIIPAPFNDTTLYDYWKEHLEYNGGTKDIEYVGGVGSGSDNAPFSYFTGVAVTDIGFHVDPKYKLKNGYPTYHTAYDNINWMESFIDPKYQIHKSCSQLTISLLLDFSESIVIPLKPYDLAQSVKNAFDDINSGTIKDELNKYKINIDYIGKEIDKLLNVSKQFEASIQIVDVNNVFNVRKINDQLMQLERYLILPTSLPDNPTVRHVVFAMSMYDKYASSGFPGIRDQLRRVSSCTTQEQCNKSLEVLKRHVSDIQVLIRQAAESLTV